MMQDRIARRESEAKNNVLAEEVHRLREEHRRRDAADTDREAQIQYQRLMLESLLQSQGIPLPASPTPESNKRQRLALPPPNRAAPAAAAANANACRPTSAPARAASISPGSTAPATNHLTAAASAATATAAATTTNATGTSSFARPAASASTAIRWTARTTADTTQSDKNITISYVLQQMNIRGLLQHVQDITVFCAPKGPDLPFIDRSKNGKKMNNCLRLVKKVWTPREEGTIRGPPVGTDMTRKAALMRAADAVEKRCLSSMLTYEASAGMEPKTKGIAKFSGLGERIRVYEKHVKEHGGENNITG